MARRCRWFDEKVIDGVPNLLALLVERGARFTGLVADDRGVDGVVRGVGAGFWGLGGVFSRLQGGRLRGYIALSAAGIVAIPAGLAFPGGFWIAVGMILFAVLTFAFAPREMTDSATERGA